MENITKNSKFVCGWGYDQTQYSVYNVVAISGKSVIVEGLNGWSHISESKLCAGSQVKVYSYKRWERLTDTEREDWESRGFMHFDYAHHMQKGAEEAAAVLTIKKVQRIDGEPWSYIWTLSDGRVIRSDENYKNDRHITIVTGYKKCLVSTKYGTPSIKVDEVITAHLDPDYERNAERYEKQNEYTAYNGR